MSRPVERIVLRLLIAIYRQLLDQIGQRPDTKLLTDAGILLKDEYER